MVSIFGKARSILLSAFHCRFISQDVVIFFLSSHHESVTGVNKPISQPPFIVSDMTATDIFIVSDMTATDYRVAL